MKEDIVSEGKKKEYLQLLSCLSHRFYLHSLLSFMTVASAGRKLTKKLAI